jgi:hypothetical protein
MLIGTQDSGMGVLVGSLAAHAELQLKLSLPGRVSAIDFRMEIPP